MFSAYFSLLFEMESSYSSLLSSPIAFWRDQYEHQLIERIVQEISSKISRVPLHIAEYPVGLDSRRFENFSVLDLSECPFITNISDMSGCPNLTELSLEKCKNLVEIHDSVGYLRKLQWLSVYDCENLRRLPHCLKLPDLEVLLLAGCSSLEKFPEIQEKMECITRLDLSGINVELPFSICNLTALEEITIMGNNGKLHLPRSTGVLPEPKDTSMEGCEVQEYQELSSTLFSNVKEIFLKNCNISEGFLRSFLTRFVNVKHLDLRGSNFLILPACIKECCYLESLDLSNCMHLREVRGIPPNIEQLHAMNCRSLNSESRSMLLSQELHDNGNKQFWVSGSTMPGWVSHRSKRPSLSFWFRNQVPTISFCCVLSKHLLYYGIFKRLLITVSINGDKIKMCHDFSPRRHMLAEDVVVLVHVITKSFLKNRGIDKVSLASEWNHVEVKAWTPYLPAIDAKEMSNATGTRVVHVGERAIDSSNFQSKQAETEFNIALVHSYVKKRPMAFLLECLILINSVALFFLFFDSNNL
ncbi:TMV resistance protein N-like isoform X1 [Senna tora]|uniref:TMV resistance protein N-like isoform X1 n=1 Tax=Senna tora TaxID=362788 RepID=A0A834T2K3_9FABA|nr:TMV resistance protein N-like isoform X1 [Senna tora]